MSASLGGTGSEIGATGPRATASRGGGVAVLGALAPAGVAAGGLLPPVRVRARISRRLRPCRINSICSAVNRSPGGCWLLPERGPLSGRAAVGGEPAVGVAGRRSVGAGRLKPPRSPGRTELAPAGTGLPGLLERGGSDALLGRLGELAGRVPASGTGLAPAPRSAGVDAGGVEAEAGAEAEAEGEPTLAMLGDPVGLAGLVGLVGLVGLAGLVGLVLVAGLGGVRVGGLPLKFRTGPKIGGLAGSGATGRAAGAGVDGVAPAGLVGVEAVVAVVAGVGVPLAAGVARAGGTGAAVVAAAGAGGAVTALAAAAGEAGGCTEVAVTRPAGWGLSGAAGAGALALVLAPALAPLLTGAGGITAGGVTA
jgi:hypothetical protein